MEILTKKINGNKYEFYCMTYQNYYNWGHKVKLYRNGVFQSSYKITYYNRTWECFKYQSTMLGAVNILYNDGLTAFINNYKNVNNKKRLTAKVKEDLKKQYNKTEAKDILKLKKIVKGNGYDLKRQFINTDF